MSATETAPGTVLLARRVARTETNPARPAFEDVVDDAELECLGRSHEVVTFECEPWQYDARQQGTSRGEKYESVRKRSMAPAASSPGREQCFWYSCVRLSRTRRISFAWMAMSVAWPCAPPEGSI